MQNPLREPPEKFGDAVMEFQDFLRKIGVPSEVKWTSPDDVLMLSPDHCLVRRRAEDESERRAEQQYKEGKQRGLGVAMIAICASGQIMWATVFTPRDNIDAQYRMMPQGVLKLSCPTDLAQAAMTTKALRWWWLKRRHSTYSSMLLTEC